MDVMEARRRLLSANTTVNLLSGVMFTHDKYIAENGAIMNGVGLQYSDIITLTAGSYLFTGINARIDSNILTNTRIHLYRNGVWVKQIAAQAARVNAPYDIHFVVTDSPSEIRVSTAYPLADGKLIAD